MDLAALIIAFFGTAAAIGSAVMAWTARADALKAQEEAKFSAERATTATERMTAMQESIFNSPPWTFEWWNGDASLLTNTSSLDAVDVTISSEPESLRITPGLAEMPARIGARSAIKVMYSGTMADPWVKNIVVRWRRDGSEKFYTWSFPIPAKPRV